MTARKSTARSSISGPHRGSILATNWVGRIASRLVKMPGLIADIRNVVFSAATADIAGLTMQQRA